VGDVYVDLLSDPETDSVKYRPMIDEPEYALKNLYKYLDNTHGNAEKKLSVFEKDDFGYPFVCNGQKGAFDFAESGAAAPTGMTLPADIVKHYQTPERYNWLQFLGILDGPSYLRNLKVYLEYYSMDIINKTTSQSREAFYDNMAGAKGTTYDLVQSHLALTLNELEGMDQESVIVRVYLSWTSYDGFTRDHEVILARRR
ncbi:MAG: hypothetical protein HRU15_21045, partial [Planctomycetes bacterium]|nr:hypothetical protein [Planctomycetota bacterium]